MDGKAVFDGSSGARGGRGFARRAVAAWVGGALRGRAKHGDQLGPAGSRDGERRAGPDGRAEAQGDAGEYAAFLARRVRDGAFTLRGLVAELAERGLKVDYRSVWNFVHAEKLSFKKNRGRQRARSA